MEESTVSTPEEYTEEAYTEIDDEEIVLPDKIEVYPYLSQDLFQYPSRF